MEKLRRTGDGKTTRQLEHQEATTTLRMEEEMGEAVQKPKLVIQWKREQRSSSGRWRHC